MSEIQKRYLDMIDSHLIELRRLSALLLASILLAALAFYTARFAWAQFQVVQLADEHRQHKHDPCESPTLTRYFGHEINDDKFCLELLEDEIMAAREVRREQLGVSLPILGMNSRFSDLLVVFPAILLVFWLLYNRALANLERGIRHYKKSISAAPETEPWDAVLSRIKDDVDAEQRTRSRLRVASLGMCFVLVVGDIYDVLANLGQINVATLGYLGAASTLTLTFFLVSRSRETPKS